MPKRIDWQKELMDGLLEAVNLNRENPSRYTSEGYLKPLCEPDKHRPFRNSKRCEVCGLVVRGEGAALPMAPGEHSWSSRSASTAGHVFASSRC